MRIAIFVFLLLFVKSAHAVAMIITAAIVGGAMWAGASVVTAIAIAIVASTVLSKVFQTPDANGLQSGDSPNLGNRQTAPPATDVKLPVIYGSAWIGGNIIDMSITSNNQEMFYVVALTEVTGTGSDVITFGDIYYGGKKVIFQGNGYTVSGLQDVSTGTTETNVSGLIEFYLYNNGSNSPTNSSQTAIQVMQNANLIYKWDATKLMTNASFMIVHLTYNNNANIRGIEQIKINVTNSRTATGDCFYDYLTNTRYGGAIPTTQINSASLNELTTYGNANFTYTDYNGFTTTQPRFLFDGVIDTKRTIMSNLQDMSSCCDCLIKYNEITAQWGVITQKATYTVAMDINDSNMVSSIQVSPIDIAGTYNIAEVKFPDQSNQDAFNSVTYDLAVIDPALMFPNEPVNKQSLNLPLVNNNVRAQYLANRFLKSAREDLMVQVSVNFVGIQLEAGDIVTVTNANYGWTAKPFRVNKVTESFGDDATVTAKLSLAEFNSTIYNDVSITEFEPYPNSGLGTPLNFGTIPTPTISNQLPNAASPSFQVNITTASSGITQYAEVWYSAYASPSTTNRIFSGTTEILPSGNPYDVNTPMPAVVLNNISAGNWYFFSRMVNSLGSSNFSSASALLQWRPTTFQYASRYLSIAYANDDVGTGFSALPSGKTYYGVTNINSSVFITAPSSYKWYPATPAFSTNNYFLYNARGRNLISFGVGEANYAAGTGVFVPSDTLNYDPSVWQALPNGLNIIDLVQRSGQLIQTGTTTVGTGEIQVTNNGQGQVIASLAQLLNFGGAYTKTSAVANLTIDIYGRVVGFEAPDSFYYSMIAYDASASQTVFTVTRSARYVVGNCLVFQNGLLLDTSQYTDTSGTVTLTIGTNLHDIVTIISMASVNSLLTTYNSFTRYTETLTNQASITITGFTLVSGYELMFLNGTVINAQDYNISGQDITFVTACSGDLQIIQWTNNNLGVPNGTPVNIDQFTIIGQSLYAFSYNPLAFNLYSNGVLLLETQDFTVATGTYTLATTPTNNTTIMVQQTFERTGAV